MEQQHVVALLEIAAIVIRVGDLAHLGLAGELVHFIVHHIPGGDSVLNFVKPFPETSAGEDLSRGNAFVPQDAVADALFPSQERIFGERALPEGVAEDAFLVKIERDLAGIEKRFQRLGRRYCEESAASPLRAGC